jgi:hypothetical protein
MRDDHPDDHPDDPAGSVGSRLKRRGIQREQARTLLVPSSQLKAPAELALLASSVIPWSFGVRAFLAGLNATRTERP